MENKIRSAILLICHLIFGQVAFSQTTDTVRLKQVNISGTRSELFNHGSKTVLSDSLLTNINRSATIAGLLENRSTVFIKSYGSGGSATISARGTEARQNAVLWNGINLNSASMGLTDLSLVPAILGDDITLYKGGGSPVNGNSAIGSTVTIENQPAAFERFNNTAISFEQGSFGTLHANISSVWSNQWVQSTSKIFHNKSDNDFTYVNITHRDHPIQKQEHAALSSYGFIQDFQVKLRPAHFINAGVWYQVTERELPALMTVPESYSEQRDSTLRTFISYKYVNNRSVLLIKGGWFREYLFYDDYRLSMHQRYLINSYFGEAEWRLQLNKKLFINTGLGIHSSAASFSEYRQTRERYTYSVFSNIHYRLTPAWVAILNLRQEIANTVNAPFSPSLTLSGVVIKNIRMLLRAGRHYSLPTMNDLYWIPGGNPQLLPEDAWSGEAELSFFNSHRFLPALTFNAYTTMVDNWITWQPGAGGIYSPENLRQVYARGFEAGIAHSWKYKFIRIQTSVEYAYCKSTVAKTTLPAESAILDKQLMYIPEHMFNSVLTFEVAAFTVTYSHRFTGKRYTTSDNSRSIPGFQVADVSVEKKFKSLPLPVALYLKIMNLYNTNYQVLAYRPTPGRWYLAGIKFDINFPYKTK